MVIMLLDWQILASDVDFWSIWNRNPTELKTMEQEKMYPPNFNLIIDGRSAVGNTRLTASFSGIDCPLVVEVPLRLPGLPASKRLLAGIYYYIIFTCFFCISFCI